jgi:tetratricopeptide (TPR) repeat protein
MADRYRLDRAVGGGYTVRRTDVVEDAFVGAAGIAGNLLGAGINGLVTASRNARDRRMQEAVDAMVSAADARQFDEFLLLASEFVRRYPQQPLGLMLLAMALVENARCDEAIAAADRAVQLGLGQSEAHTVRAQAYLRKGALGKAIQEYTALTRDPETRGSGLLGRARALIQIGDLEQALDDASQAIAVSPDEFGYRLRADIYRAKGELDKAIDDYTRANRLDPTWAEVLERRAEAYDLLGKAEEARADRAALETLGADDPLLDEARGLLSHLREHGVRLKVASNSRDIEYSGARPIGETLASMKRLKPQLLQLLMEERSGPGGMA